MRLFYLSTFILYLSHTTPSNAGILDYCCFSRNTTDSPQSIELQENREEPVTAFVVFFYALTKPNINKSNTPDQTDQTEKDYRVIVMHSKEYHENSSNSSSTFAGNFDINDDTVKYNQKICHDLFQNIPKEFTREQKTCFNKGNASVIRLINLNAIYRHNNNIKRKDSATLLNKIPTCSKKILHRGKGELSDDEVAQLKTQGVELKLSDAEIDLLQDRFQSILKNRQGYFRGEASQTSHEEEKLIKNTVNE